MLSLLSVFVCINNPQASQVWSLASPVCRMQLKAVSSTPYDLSCWWDIQYKNIVHLYQHTTIRFRQYHTLYVCSCEARIRKSKLDHLNVLSVNTIILIKL